MKTIKRNGEKYLVTFDIPQGLGKARLYREINRIAAEMDFERIGGSVYIVNSDYARERAHALAELASQFGAGKVGEQGGPSVWRIAEESPQTYFEQRDLAKRVVEELLVDHRYKINKRKTRSIPILIAELRDPDASFMDELRIEKARRVRPG